MNATKLRRQIAWEAARLMHERQEAEYFRARMAAARRICRGWVKPTDLPTDAEIHDQLQMLAGLYPGPGRPVDRAAAIPWPLPSEGSIAGDEAELSEAEVSEQVDRFLVFQSLLLPCEAIQQSPTHHPEGDVLYHSLQVFDRAQDRLPYDEEFLTAALLHDVGKAIDPDDHVAAALDALDGHITERTAWLIDHHQQAHALREGTIGHRARRRLKESPDYEALVLLGECDRAGRVSGVETSELEEALDYLRDLSPRCG